MKKAFCFNICARHFLRQNLSTSDLSFCQVTSVEKRELQEHFSASAYGLSFKKLSFSSLFSTSVTWQKLKSDVDKFCIRRVEHKYRNKILFFHLQDNQIIHKNLQILIKQTLQRSGSTFSLHADFCEFKPHLAQYFFLSFLGGKYIFNSKVDYY